ncbi:hypothetical protein [Methylotuvimicrobium sp. KM2]
MIGYQFNLYKNGKAIAHVEISMLCIDDVQFLQRNGYQIVLSIA